MDNSDRSVEHHSFMEKLIAYFLQFGNLTEDDISALINKFQVLHLQKEGYLSKAGKVPKQVGFIISGVIRMFNYNDQGDEVTTYFIDENRLVVDYARFESGAVAPDYLQAATDCTVLIIDKKDWDALFDLIPAWREIVNNAVKHAFQIHLERRTSLVTENAKDRYLSFLKQFPMLANRVSQTHIASYLGITRFSLSRIRKSIR